MLKKTLKLIVCVLLPLMVGILSAFFTKDNITDWYSRITKPSFNPPNYLFAPVWTVLYILMGISLFMIWNDETKTSKSKAYFIWGLQLALNFLWSIIFFYMKEIGLALTDIILLLLSISFMIVIFYPINKNAALLQLPYLAWVLFAATLNLVIWELN